MHDYQEVVNFTDYRMYYPESFSNLLLIMLHGHPF